MHSLRFAWAPFAVWILTVGALPAHAMNKAELINQLSNRTGVSMADAKLALDGFIGATTGFVDEGDRVVLQHFGVFGLKHLIAASDGVESTTEIDFLAGAAFHASNDALADAFRMRAASVHEAAHTVQQPAAHVVGPARGMIAVGDIVFLERGSPSDLAPGRSGILPLDLLESVVPFVVGDVNGDGRVDALDVQVVINAALGLPVELDKSPDNGDAEVPGPLAAQVAGVVVMDETGERVEVDEAQVSGETIGLLLQGVDRHDIKRGMIISKPVMEAVPGIPEEKQDAWFDGHGQAAGGLRSDGELVQAMGDSTGLPRGILVAAYNALLTIIVDEVNGGGIVDIAGFGRFGEETRVTVAIVDPCAGDRENCLGAIEDMETLEELLGSDYIPWDVTVAATGPQRRELSRLVDHVARMAKTEILRGDHAHTGKDILIASDKSVVFKAVTVVIDDEFDENGDDNDEEEEEE